MQVLQVTGPDISLNVILTNWQKFKIHTATKNMFSFLFSLG
jgi:hypothetical protein